MKIIYFYQFFTTPNGSYGTRVYEFAKKWVENGHKVTVVTSVFYKSDLKSEKFLDSIIIDGINVKIINIKINNKDSISKRIINFLIYSFFSIYFAISEKYDVAIASSPPLSASLPLFISKFIKKKKVVFEVRDLWPEAPIELGIIKNKILLSLLYKYEKLCYKISDLIITLSIGMQENIHKRFNNLNIKTITNFANIELFSNNHELPSILNKNIKYAIYNGNIGEVNNSKLLYECALRLKFLKRNDIVILMIGDGQLKNELENKSRDLLNIQFLEMMPKRELISYIKNSFVSIIPLKNINILNTSSPNKLFESMAAGIPIIQTTTGWIKKMIEQVDCGFTVENDSKILVDKLIYLADNEEKRNELGKRALAYAKNKFDKDKLSMKMLNLIIKLFMNETEKK